MIPIKTEIRAISGTTSIICPTSYPVSEFAAGVNDTGGKQWEQYQTADTLKWSWRQKFTYMLTLISKGVPTKLLKFFWLRFFSFATGVNDTGGQPWAAIISANFRKNLKRPYWYTQELGGNWFMKKTSSRKSRGTVPLIKSIIFRIWRIFMHSCSQISHNNMISPKVFADFSQQYDFPKSRLCLYICRCYRGASLTTWMFCPAWKETGRIWSTSVQISSGAPASREMGLTKQG